MANPQLENGYTKIANEILESLYRISFLLSHYEWKCLMFIFRKIYGWRKTEDRISLSQFSEGTDIATPHVCRAIKKLVRKNIITQIGNGYHVTYSFQKDYTKWKPLPKQVITTKPLPKQVIPITQTGKKPLPKQADTKENKETITKEIISQISDLLRQFPLTLQDKAKAYCDRARLKNKSKTITDSRRLTLINELHNARSCCNNDLVFAEAIDAAIGYDAPNIRYINAVIKNKTVDNSKSEAAKKNDGETDSVICKRLGKIAPISEVKKVLYELPRSSWYKVKYFLKKQYPEDGDRCYSRAEQELISETNKQEQKKELVAV